MDVMPNRDVYYQVSFVVCRVDKTQWMRAKRLFKDRKRVFKDRKNNAKMRHTKTITTKKTLQRPTAKLPKVRRTADLLYEMEAIIAVHRSPVLTRWFDHVIAQVKTYTYDLVFSKWAPMRHVLYTTGPFALNKYLKLDEQKYTMENMNAIE